MVAVAGWFTVVFGAAGLMTLLGRHPDDYGCAPLCVLIIGPLFGIFAARYFEEYMESTKDCQPCEPNSTEFKRQVALLKTDEQKIDRVRGRAGTKKWHEKIEYLVRTYGKDGTYEDGGFRFRYRSGDVVAIEFNGSEVYRAHLVRIDVALDDDHVTIRHLPASEQHDVHIVHTYLPGEWEELYDQIVKAAAARHEEEMANSRRASLEDEKKRFGI